MHESERTSTAPIDARAEIEAFQTDCRRLTAEVGKVIVGQDDTVVGVLICLLAGGHGLLEGVPGLGKTMLVRTLAEALELSFSRIQFTPDLMPADIVGTTVITEREGGRKEFYQEFRQGPIFANVVLADEINRATPKTQSALLEAMQEQSVTVAKSTHALEAPFMVLATQNPLEMEGTYPLPEAQLDRFLLKLHVPFPSRGDLHTILERTTVESMPEVRPSVSRARVLEMRKVVRRVEVAHHVQDYAIRLLQATHPDQPSAPEMVRQYVRYGASPRAAQAMLLGGKVRALLDAEESRGHASKEDVAATCKPAMRHRIILNFEGEAEGIKPDEVLDEVLEKVPRDVAD
jgi:MoxR-like ATPase